MRAGRLEAGKGAGHAPRMDETQWARVRRRSRRRSEVAKQSFEAWMAGKDAGSGGALMTAAFPQRAFVQHDRSV